MPETNLHKQIQELESENRLLRSENERLRKSLGLPFEETPKTQNTPATDNQNTTQEANDSVTKLGQTHEIYLISSLK